MINEAVRSMKPLERLERQQEEDEDEQSAMIFFIQLTKPPKWERITKRDSEIFILQEKSLINDSFIRLDILFKYSDGSEIIKILFVDSSSAVPQPVAKKRNLLERRSVEIERTKERKSNKHTKWFHNNIISLIVI